MEWDKTQENMLIVAHMYWELSKLCKTNSIWTLDTQSNCVIYVAWREPKEAVENGKEYGREVEPTLSGKKAVKIAV